MIDTYAHCANVYFVMKKKTFSSSYVHYIYLLFNINILEAKKKLFTK